MRPQPSRQEIVPYFDKLVDAYRAYCVDVSKRSMALSIETCAYVWWLCDELDARSVCDLGSGFSSYTLRRYAQTIDPPITVASVDDAPMWLRATADFLVRHDMTSAGLHPAHVWLTMDDRYDVIVHDFSGGDVRNAWMWHAAERLNPGGVLVFDDAQNHGHHFEMGAVARHHGWDLLDGWEQTVDEVGRYAAMVVNT
jgi:predicted O-methyltransferase YrrM